MVRKGRALEEFVASLETILSGADIEISSPDYIMGVNSKSPREIDVSLKTQVGSTQILVILECRDRKGKGDVSWIEQLAQKKSDVQAAKAIAVSSSGFTNGAINTANQLDIDLRSFDDLTLEQVRTWFQHPAINITKRCYDFDYVQLRHNMNNGELKQAIENIDINTPIFINPQVSSRLSIKDVWLRIIAQHPEIYDEAHDNGEPILKYIPVKLQDDNYVQSGEKLVRIEEINFLVKLWIEVSKALPSQIVQYSQQSTPLTQSVRFNIDAQDKEIKLDVHHIIGKHIQAKLKATPFEKRKQ